MCLASPGCLGPSREAYDTHPNRRHLDNDNFVITELNGRNIEANVETKAEARKRLSFVLNILTTYAIDLQYVISICKLEDRASRSGAV